MVRQTLLKTLVIKCMQQGKEFGLNFKYSKIYRWGIIFNEQCEGLTVWKTIKRKYQE